MNPTIDIWGSCVSRDTLMIGGNDKNVTIKHYFEGCSFPLQFTQHICPDVKMEDYEGLTEHNFKKRNACVDVNKNIPSILDNSESEWLILDTRSFGYGIVKAKCGNDGYELFTKREAFIRLQPLIQKKIIKERTELSVYDADIKDAIDKFIDWCQKRYGNKIVLIEVIESELLLDYDGSIGRNHKTKEHQFMENETLFTKMFVNKTKCHVIRAPPLLMCDYHHKWGWSSVHYVEEYYQYAYNALMAILYSQDSDTLRDLLDELYYNITYTLSRIANNSIKSERNTLECAHMYAEMGDSTKALSILDQLKEQGVYMSDVYKSRLYAKGLGVEKNLPYAIDLLYRTIQQAGETLGKNVRIELFDYIWELNQSNFDKLLFDLVISGAESNDPESILRLSSCYRFGRGVEIDKDKALLWLKKAVDKNSKEARKELLDLLSKEVSEKSKSEFIKYATEFSNNGDSYAMGQLGTYYFSKPNVADHIMAAELLKKALNKDRIWACKLIDCLWKIGTPEANCEAASIAKQYAAFGDGGSIGRLGRAYRDGKGVEKNLSLAAEFMRRASKKKVLWAYNELFDILWEIGTPETYAEAFNVANNFSKTGNSGALGRLGRAYRDGKGVEVDLLKAQELLEQACLSNPRWNKDLESVKYLLKTHN